MSNNLIAMSEYTPTVDEIIQAEDLLDDSDLTNNIVLDKLYGEDLTAYRALSEGRAMIYNICDSSDTNENIEILKSTLEAYKFVEEEINYRLRQTQKKRWLGRFALPRLHIYT